MIDATTVPEPIIVMFWSFDQDEFLPTSILDLLADRTVATRREAANAGDAELAMTRRRIVAVLSKLRPMCRVVLWLRYLQGNSVADIAHTMQTTERYAGMLIHSCLVRAREVFEDTEGAA